MNSRTCGANAFARSPGPAGHIKRALVAARSDRGQEAAHRFRLIHVGRRDEASTCAVNCVTVSRASTPPRYTSDVKVHNHSCRARPGSVDSSDFLGAT
jgi:hypothetical protein